MSRGKGHGALEGSFVKSRFPGNGRNCHQRLKEWWETTRGCNNAIIYELLQELSTNEKAVRGPELHNAASSQPVG